MLGYPIRTPSDHSSVDNSPRTIAASHVLHRLLMPRHPPCALQHFNNKKSQTTKPDTKRCSHPLCNTQHTTTPQPHTTTTTPTPTHNQGDTLDGQARSSHTKKTPPTAGVSSGPNSMPNPLLTHKYAKKPGLCSTQPHPQRAREYGNYKKENPRHSP